MAAARGPRQQPPRRTAGAIKLSSITRMLIWLLRELGHSFLARAVEANLPNRHAESNRRGIQMTQNHSQCVSELLPARRLHIVYLAATKRSPQQPWESRT
jgi:hypothetical protein